ncbi:MAG: hypothetical protein AAF225_05530 [Pseudomonadota bacterium]
MKPIAILMTTAALSFGSAQAKMLNFEDFGAANGDLATVAGTEFEDEFGITFSSNDGLRIIQVGGPTNGCARQPKKPEEERAGHRGAPQYE